MSKKKEMFILRSPEVKKNCLSFIKDLNENKTYTVEIAEKKPTRSTQQNRLLWAWYKHICDYNGDHKGDLHEEMKVRVLGTYEKEVAGVKLVYPKSSTDLTVEKMGIFLSAVEMLADELGVVLPPTTYYGYQLA